jgi:PAS domain S-box-containing protein
MSADNPKKEVVSQIIVDDNEDWDLKAALEQARRSEERFRALVSQATAGITQADPTGRFLFVNDRYCEIVGYSRGELLQMRMQDITDPDVVVANVELYQRLWRDGTPFVIEKQYIRKDGSRVWVNNSVSAVLGGDGKPESVVCVTLDITERKRADQALRTSEERYRRLYESIDEGFCIIEVMFDENKRAVDYVFVEVNPSFERQTGIKDAHGRSMRNIAPHHEEHWFELYGNIALTGQSLRFEYPAVELHRWYEGYAYRIGEAHERKVAIIFNDITERKRTEGEREKLVAELQRERQRLKGFQTQLQEKIVDLEKFNDVVVGRELKLIQLEKEIEALRRSRL